MSTVCTKDYILTVNHALTLDAYWTFEQMAQDLVFPGSWSIVDHVGSIPVTWSGVWGPGGPNFPLQLQSGFIGNGLSYIQEGSGAHFASANVEPKLKLQTANGWSVFFWFKVVNWAAAYSQYPQINWRFANNSDFFLQFGDFPAVHDLEFLIDDDNFNSYTPANFPITLNTWYFLHLFYDPVATAVGYQVNNGSRVLAAGPPPLFTPAVSSGFLDFFQNWPAADTSNVGLMVDEFGMKLSRILTPTELSFLYNSGSGRTWPL